MKGEILDRVELARQDAWKKMDVVDKWEHNEKMLDDMMKDGRRIWEESANNSHKCMDMSIEQYELLIEEQKKRLEILRQGQ